MERERRSWDWQVAGFDRSVDNKNNSQKVMDAVLPKLLELKDNLSTTRAEWLSLRQEASDLQEYSNAKISRVTRYLGFLAEKANNLDQICQVSESKIASLILERKNIFNEIQAIKGNIRIFCRVRPQFEHEGSSAIEFPDVFTVRIKSDSGLPTYSDKVYEFDRVYGSHVGQGELFHQVQPFVQSAFDGFNSSIFCYGTKGSGKTYTMEGSVHDRGVYFRAFEELFDLANVNATGYCRFYFYVSMFGICNEEIQDLLLNTNEYPAKIKKPNQMSSTVHLVQEKIENPSDFSEVIKRGIENRELNILSSKSYVYSHTIVTIHIQNFNIITRECQNSKLSLVDLSRSERLLEGASEDVVDAFSKASISLSTLGDVLSALTGSRDNVPYGESKLTQILSDSLGGDSKTLMIVNINPCYADIENTISSLDFASRARNTELTLQKSDNRQKWRDMVNEAQNVMMEKERHIFQLQNEITSLKRALKDADDQCVLLFSETQKAWKLTSAMQNDLKNHSTILEEKKSQEEEITNLKSQLIQLRKLDEEQKIQLQASTSRIQALENKLKDLESKPLNTNISVASSNLKPKDENANISSAVRKLEDELAKRDKLIERLHKENQKLFERLTDKPASTGLQKVANNTVSSKASDDLHSEASHMKHSDRLDSLEERTSAGIDSAKAGPLALRKPTSEKLSTTPAGEYLTGALGDFDPDQYETPEALADGANKLLMLVLAAVIKAGAPREHEILAEIRDAVLAFIYKMEHKGAMDTMLVSRVRILYIRSLVNRSPELHSLKVPPAERFLEKANTGRSRNVSRGSSRDSSPGRSPRYLEHNSNPDLIDDHVHGFKVNIRQDRKSKFSSLVLKLRGIDEETWRQHITSEKLKELNEEARSFAIGNKPLAALFVHTPAGELQRQIRAWLAEKFDFLSVTGSDGIGVAGQLELLATAIMDGWMAGLGIPLQPSTDALGQLMSDYAKMVYTSQLQNLKDIAGTLAAEEADDFPNIIRLRSALESVEHKRRKILQHIRTDTALLTKEQGGSPVRTPSTSEEDARLASLIALEEILKRLQDINEKSSEKAMPAAKKRSFLASLDEISERMSSLLTMDQACAQRHITEVRDKVQAVEELSDPQTFESDVVKWTVLQFNTGSTTPFIIKCGANSNMELVVKGQAKLEDKSGNEIVAIVPKPTALEHLSLEEIKHLLSPLPESLCQLALARTVDGSRARFTRLYKTLATRVPALKNTLSELEKDASSSQDVTMPGTPSKLSTPQRLKSQSES